MTGKKNRNDEHEKLLRTIHILAERLPWVAVIAVLLAAILTILQALFTSI